VPDLLVESIVVEQAIELDKRRIALVGQFGHAGKHIFGGVAVDEHGGATLSPMPRRALAHPTMCPADRSPSIPSSCLPNRTAG